MWKDKFKQGFRQNGTRVVLVGLLILVPVENAMAKGAFSVTFSQGDHFLPDSPYSSTSAIWGVGNEASFFELGYRINPLWGVSLASPIYGRTEGISAGLFEAITVNLYSLVPHYFFIRSPDITRITRNTFELYGGAGPVRYNEIVVERLGFLVETQRTGAMALLGGEMRGRGLGIVLEVRHYFISDIPTPRGTLKAGGSSINLGLRFHLEGPR